MLFNDTKTLEWKILKMLGDLRSSMNIQMKYNMMYKKFSRFRWYGLNVDKNSNLVLLVLLDFLCTNIPIMKHNLSKKCGCTYHIDIHI